MIIRYILFALLCAAPSVRAYELPLSTGTHRVVFSSEEGEFNEYTRLTNLKGNVQLDEVGADDKIMKTIKTRELTVNMASSTIHIPADFVMEDSSVTVYGKSGIFDYGKDIAYIDQGRFSYKNFVFTGRKVELTKKRYVYKKAAVTTCEDTPPHYKVRASRVYLAPERYFLAYNTLFFVGGVPVFYFPVLYKPIGGGTPFVSSFYPGYDERSGVYLKSNFVYRFDPYTKGKLFLDYFSKKGFGTGAEVDYHRREKNISNLSIYRIREYGASADRWGANGGYWHSFNKFNETDKAAYYSQSFFRLLSDPEFNNDFFRSNPFAVSTDKQASLAFTRKSNTTVMRLSFYGKYDRTTDLKHFYKSYESAPRLDLQTVPLRIGKLPFLNSFNGYFESAKEVGVPYYQRKGRGAWTVSKTVPIVKNIIFFPSVFYDQRVFVATSSYSENQWVGRYGTNLNLRYDRLWGSLDFKYSYQGRMAVNEFKKDLGAADKGDEVKSIFSELFITPVSNTYFRVNTSYDLRAWARGTFSHRLSPLTGEFYHAPRRNLDIYLQDSYSFAHGNQSFVAQVNAGDDKNYVGLGLANYSLSPSAYVVNQTLGYQPSWASTWRTEMVLRYKLVHRTGFDLRSFYFFEKTFALYKDFHDFRTRWDVRLRPGVREFFFLITLKMSDAARRDPLDDVSRNYWHPWRKEGQLRD